jgi:hypothetical protein
MLADMWNALPDEYLCKIKVRMTDGSHGQIEVEEVNPVPDEFALLLGEMLYQSRAALDACIYQATAYHTGKFPPDKETSLEYPITSDATEFPKLVQRRLWGLPQDVIDGIEMGQPFNVPNTTGKALMETTNRNLAILNDLARKDRHRALHVVGSLPIRIVPQFRLPEGVSVKNLNINAGPQLLTDGTVLATFELNGFQSGTGMQVGVSAGMATGIGCLEPPAPCCPEDTFSARLGGILGAVSTIVSAFENYNF